MAGTSVECYAGYRYPERPRAFLWQGDRVVVEEVERSWRTPASPVFCIRAAGGRRFILAYDEAADVWDVRPADPQRGEVI
jgi:hypothetical protein